MIESACFSTACRLTAPVTKRVFSVSGEVLISNPSRTKIG
jgi:hypothetical protein